MQGAFTRASMEVWVYDQTTHFLLQYIEANILWSVKQFTLTSDKRTEQYITARENKSTVEPG